MPRFPLVFLCFAFALVPPALAGSRSASECAARFHEKLADVRSGPFAKIAEARALARRGDERLPGRLVLTPASGRRSGEEAKSLRIATGLARARGRASWAGDSDSRWIADRIVTDLSDFLGQAPAPYLCAGTENYVSTMRSYLDRIGSGSSETLTALTDAQTTRTRRSLAEAYAAMRPVPLPHFAPSVRPADVQSVPIALDLRPSLTVGERRDGLDPMTTQGLAKAPYGPAIDPDLPPKSRDVVALASEGERLTAIAALLGRAEARGFLASPASANRTETERALAELRPVLGALRVAETRLEASGRMGDPLVAPALRAALSDIEVLDYLAHAAEEGPDPLLAAIEATLQAIMTAHESAERGV
ncbi:hypothetical protein SAMN06297251_11127 [Fulvimarina manganoxydans]|uniref:Uncharacterized protein n=1 Tax=Fulvimarina manganoxydans TaxID=937218 RepID=A0A1W2CSV3_9HYPH|nr:hypothetical protein [Fulvimarina manganoxydans]SMC87748.1 hypothetical protein SAMN06297251_11127 [Fulvimarina manganoxydans]